MRIEANYVGIPLLRATVPTFVWKHVLEVWARGRQNVTEGGHQPTFRKKLKW